MSFPIDFDKTTASVIGREPPQILVRWSLKPTRVKLDDFEFYIDRGDAEPQRPAFQHVDIDGNPIEDDSAPSSSNENLAQIAGPINALDFYEFRDFTMTDRNINKQFHYRVRCRKISTQEEIATPTFTWDGIMDNVGLYIIDELNFLLEDSTGVPCFMHVRRRNGVLCGNCFDKISGKRLRSNCNVCYGTNWEGGFYKPLDGYVDFSPSPNATLIQEWGETQPNETDVLMSNYPQLSPGDLIRELRRQRLWRVVRIKETEKRRVPMMQFVRVVELNPKDIEHQIPYDSDLALAILDKFDEMRMKREF